jgi:hypothetical protein
MTDLARYEPTTAVTARDTVDGWVAMIQPIAELAANIANTDFVPAALRGKPAAVTAAMLAGRELGLGPIQSMQHMHVIDGRPAVSAEIARALALAQGHDIHIEESTTQRCVVRGRRRNSQEWVTVTWTMDDAKRAGLDGRQGWRKYPRRYLQARATGELCHLIFADAIGGMPFTIEEIEDDTDTAGRIDDGQAPSTERRTARRKSAATPAKTAEAAPEPPVVQRVTDGPPLPGEPGYDDPVAPPARDAATPEPTPSGPAHVNGADNSGECTPAQMRNLFRLLGDVDVHDRDDRLRITGQLIGHPISSWNELTKTDASTLIDTLETCAQQDDPQGALLRLLDAVEKTDGVARTGGDGT